ncbi:MAG: FprA family A-type flavoprotein [Muribaculaceae bacterium]|nr:FprA family A-type flavoprotein [Muribaculaceae bacterium]
MQITNDIFHVGVNDHDVDLFEGQYVVPIGMAYHSYVIIDEKIAVLDTVDAKFSAEWLSNIRQVLNGRTPDYLIVQHMECDHSANIMDFMREFPDTTLVGNAKTFTMLANFFEDTENLKKLTVKENDTLTLGKHILNFVFAPMVHWPETMMTYVKERGVLFSGDAFGTFGALNGGVTDLEMDTDWYWNEMYRYYSNIVGKYGVSVQRALSKLKGIDLQYICSTHGPVWHDHVGKVMDIYDRLSRYEAEDGVVIIYGSMYGNTGVIAEALGRELAARGVRRIKIHNATRSSMSDMLADTFRYKGLVVGGPTYSMHLFPAIEQFMIAIETRELKNRIFGSFGSFSWASAVAGGMQHYTTKMKMNSVEHIEMKHSADETILTAVASLADKIVAGLNAES